jgi:hypothetical protein
MLMIVWSFIRQVVIMPIKRLVCGKKLDECNCLNCEYSDTLGAFCDCDSPGFIPERIFEKYGDEDLPKYCGFYKAREESI